jgi:solute carrier family 25 oxoglutarate transporter 11
VQFDFVKTRLQKQKQLPDGSYPYKGFADCAVKSAKAEGFSAFYKGFTVFCVRVGPHAMITLITLEALNNQVKKMGWSP